MPVQINRLCVILLLIIAVVLIIAPTIADAQISPGPIQNKPVITYTPPNEIKWILESTNGDEIVVPKQIAPNSWQFDITPDPTKLTTNEIKDYPFELFCLVYPGTDPCVKPVKVPIDSRLYTVRDIPKTDNALSEIVYNRKVNLDKNKGLTITAPTNVLRGAYIKYGVHSATVTAVANTITWESGDSTQYFEDIYQADLANGWGVVTSCGTGCYCIDAFIVHQTGDVTDLATTVRWKNGLRTSNGTTLFKSTGGTATFGSVISLTDKSTQGGCTFIGDIPAGNFYGNIFKEIGGNIYLNGCSLTRASYLQSLNNTASSFWDCTLSNGPVISGDSDVFNTTISGAYSGMTNTSGGNVNIFDCSFVARCTTQSIILNNIYARSNNKLVRMGGANDAHLINCDIVPWDLITWDGGATGSVYRQYSLDCTVQTQTGTPIQNTNVQIWTVGGTPIANLATSASGTITQQTITHSTYQQANGNTPTLHTPHRIRITMDGYYPYEDVIMIDKPTDLHISLTEIPEDETATTLQAWMQSNIIDWLEVGFMETITGLIFVLAIVALAFRYGGWLLHIFASTICFGFGIYYFDNELIIYSVPLICLGILIIGQELNLMVSRRKHR